MASADEEKQVALTHLAQGKRHLLVKDYFDAVSSLASACECLAKIYGDDANECGEAYYNYGKALLELARRENGVLGNAVEEETQSGDDEDESDEEEAVNDKEESEVKPDQNGNASGEHSDATTPVDAGESKVEVGGGDAEKMNNSGSDLQKDEAGDAKTNGENETLDPSVENDEDEEGDISNMKLAWEILELAKSIFQRQVETDKTIELKLAEVHLLLGEIGLETENFTQGTEDMLTCLELQKINLQPDNRRIAETYYQIGMGYGMAHRFDEAIDAYTKCGEVLKKRITTLKNASTVGLKPEGDDPFYTFEEEIRDLEELFPEIQEKILDMKDFKNETKKAMLKATLGQGSDPGAGSSKDPTFEAPSASFGGRASSLTTDAGSSSEDAAKPVSNIGHLVRKKPRPDLDSESSGPENVKRVCTEEDKKQ